MINTSVSKDTPICPHCRNYDRHHMYPLIISDQTNVSIPYRTQGYQHATEPVTPIVCAQCGTVFIPTWTLNHIIIKDMDFSQDISDEP